MPYTFTDLKNYLDRLEKLKGVGGFLTRNELCRTLAGNKWEYLTITTKGLPGDTTRKKGVFLSARVHPGETGASWMMEGVINFLTSNTQEAQILRDKFVFKIVPMLNPDGVVHGNYRCSLAGCDLNRRWKNPSPVLHPTVYHSKQLAIDFGKSRDIILYWDLHGHSRKKNLFFYGNSNNDIKEEVRLFPFIMSKIWEEFSYKLCRFKVQRHKESTSRIAMWRSLSTNNVFTLEASFWGPNIGPLKDNHFRIEDYHSIGHKLWQAILVYAKIEWDSLKQYLEIKDKDLELEEQEQEEKQEQGKKQKDTDKKNNKNGEITKQPSIKSHSQPPIVKPSNIKFEKKSECGVSSICSSTTLGQNHNVKRELTPDEVLSSYGKFDKIWHTNLISGKTNRPCIKIKSRKEQEKVKTARNDEPLSRTQNVIRSLNTSVLLEEFKKWNENQSDDDMSSESGETTSGSESNFDEKDLVKILPSNKMKWHSKSKRSKNRKYFSLKYQRINSKWDKSSSKLNTIQKPISRSESYRKIKRGDLNKTSTSGTGYISSLCKSSNNLQDKGQKVPDNSMNISR